MNEPDMWPCQQLLSLIVSILETNFTRRQQSRSECQWRRQRYEHERTSDKRQVVGLCRVCQIYGRPREEARGHLQRNRHGQRQ